MCYSVEDLLEKIRLAELEAKELAEKNRREGRYATKGGFFVTEEQYALIFYRPEDR